MSQYTDLRVMMVDTQVRPSDVTKFPIIEAMLVVPREDHVPASRRAAAYVGGAVPYGNGRELLEARTLAKLLDAMDVQDYDLAEWILLQGASVKIETPAGGTPANAVEFYLKKFRPGTPTHDQVLRLKALMQARGAVFPAPTPPEIRERRARGGGSAAQ